MSAVASLLELCVHFVADHIDHVDSLIGFPDIIGRQVLDRAALNGTFSKIDGQCLKAISLFNAAYPGQLLSSVSLFGQPRYIHWEPVLELVAADIAALQLISCPLNTASLLLQKIACCETITQLVLRDCGLTDIHVQKLTLRARSLGNCLRRLQLLDMRHNCLTFKSVLKLLRIRPEILAVTQSVNADQLATVKSLKYQRVSELPGCCQIVCNGWLADIAWQHWTCDAQQTSTSASSRKFYGTGKRARVSISPASADKENELFLQRMGKVIVSGQ